jgi:hypothetical protein
MPVMPASRAVAIRLSARAIASADCAAVMNLVRGFDLIIHHQQRGAPWIDIRKLRHGFPCR